MERIELEQPRGHNVVFIIPPTLLDRLEASVSEGKRLHIEIDLAVSPHWLFGLCLESEVPLSLWFQVCVCEDPREGGRKEQSAAALVDV